MRLTSKNQNIKTFDSSSPNRYNKQYIIKSSQSTTTINPFPTNLKLSNESSRYHPVYIDTTTNQAKSIKSLLPPPPLSLTTLTHEKYLTHTKNSSQITLRPSNDSRYKLKDMLSSYTNRTLSYNVEEDDGLSKIKPKSDYFSSKINTSNRLKTESDDVLDHSNMNSKNHQQWRNSSTSGYTCSVKKFKSNSEYTMIPIHMNKLDLKNLITNRNNSKSSNRLNKNFLFEKKKHSSNSKINTILNKVKNNFAPPLATEGQSSLSLNGSSSVIMESLESPKGTKLSNPCTPKTSIITKKFSLIPRDDQKTINDNHQQQPKQQHQYGEGIIKTSSSPPKKLLSSSSPRELSIDKIKEKYDHYTVYFLDQIHEFNKKTNLFSSKNQKKVSHYVGHRAKSNMNKHVLMKKFKRNIYIVLRKMETSRLTIQDIFEYNVFPTHAYEHPKSKAFFNYIKQNNIEKLKDLLKQRRFLVYEYDEIHQTGLHWAAKRCNRYLVYLLLKNGANPDAIDISGRTPLFLAARGGDALTVKLILSYQANPILRSDSDKTALDYAINYDVSSLIKTGVKIHTLLEINGSRKTQQMNWIRARNGHFNVKEEEIIPLTLSPGLPLSK